MITTCIEGRGYYWPQNEIGVKNEKTEEEMPKKPQWNRKWIKNGWRLDWAMYFLDHITFRLTWIGQQSLIDTKGFKTIAFLVCPANESKDFIRSHLFSATISLAKKTMNDVIHIIFCKKYSFLIFYKITRRTDAIGNTKINYNSLCRNVLATK